MLELNVTMLNGFSIQYGNRLIDDKDNRAKKLWLLLAYLIYYRNREISRDELYRLLWEDENNKDKNGQQNALRVMLHRARTLLEDLSSRDGQDLILRKKNGYQWSPEAAVQLDTEKFEKLCDAADAEVSPAKKQTLYQKALDLYQTDFLEKLSDETWVRYLAVQYHQRYLEAVQALCDLLEKSEQWDTLVTVTQVALNVEPFSEEICYIHMKSLLNLGRTQEAAEAYLQMRQVLADRFGTIPAEPIRKLFYKTAKTPETLTVPIEILSQNLTEKGKSDGAFECDYDFFKSIYRATARAIARSGIPVHMALLTIAVEEGKELSEQDLKHAMKCLHEQAQNDLRQGDVMTQCSPNQFALLLQLATYENSCKVCQRIIKNYQRKYPAIPAEIWFSVQAVNGKQ